MVTPVFKDWGSLQKVIVLLCTILNLHHGPPFGIICSTVFFRIQTVANDERDLTEEEIEQLTQLMQMLALEDAQSQVASSSNETLNGYIPIVERKLHEYIVAFNTVKAEVDQREKEKKVKTQAERELKKEEKKTLAGKPITINIHYALSGNGFPITVPQNTTIGEFRRIILAHVNSMNPSGGLGLGKARMMTLMMNDMDVSLHRKTF